MQKETSKENDQISDEKKYLHFFAQLKVYMDTIEHLTFHSLKKSVICNKTFYSK